MVGQRAGSVAMGGVRSQANSPCPAPSLLNPP